MIESMLAFRQRLRVALLAVMMTFALPGFALAADDEEGPTHDARLDNYPQPVVLEQSGTAPMWGLMVLLALLSVGVMFKSSNRTHLD